jgi:hypothetical protein
MVITGQVGSRHRSKRDARAEARRNRILHALLRRYRRSDWVDRDGMYVLSATGRFRVYGD